MLDHDRAALVAYRTAYCPTADGVRPIAGADHRTAGRAIAALIDRYRPLARSIRQSHFPTLRDEDAEDALTDALLAKSFPVDLDAGSLAAWLRTVIRNALIDLVRSARYRYETSTDLDDFTDDAVDDEESNLLRAIARTLTTLAAGDEHADRLVEAALECAILPALSGHSPVTRDELAARYGISEWGSRTLLREARGLAARASSEVLATRI